MLVLTFVVGLAALPARGGTPVCFTSADNAKLSYVIIQQTPPPASGAEASYPYYPYSHIVTMQLGRIGSGSNVENQYYAQWANRSDQPVLNASGRRAADRKANLQPRRFGERMQRSQFSSIDRANICTLAQTATALGLPGESIGKQARALGVTLQPEAATPDTGGVAPENLCVLPDGMLVPGAAGVMLDYEVQDGRTPVQTTAFLISFADMVHRAGRKVGLLLNPLDAPTQAWTGIDRSNAAAIARTYDWSTIFLWSTSRQQDIIASFRSQMRILGAGGGVDPQRLVVDFELANTSLEDARVVREIVLSNHLSGVMLWRHGATQGGRCEEPVNLKIACVALGRCGGR